MAQKGSKRNPYSGSEYINICETSEWRGGWVLYEATNLKCYITQHRTEYRERDGEILGGEYNPYTYAVYNEMKGLEIWEGGWVLPNPSNPDTRGTTYHTAGDEIFGVINLIPLGEEENPFPADVYSEMVINEIWLGGWVLYLSGNKEYIESMYGNGSGSGCGCGSGCGSGNSLIAGEATIRPNGLPVNNELVITWGAGTFSGSQTGPSLSAILRNYNTLSETSVTALWEGPYRVVINANVRELVNGIYMLFPFTVYYDIPGAYRG